LQASLLRFVELGEFRRVGETRIRQARARVVAATHVDLDAAVERGEFRRDLLYRLDVVRIELPPLRERPEDVPELVAYFLRGTAARLGVPMLELEPETLAALSEHAYPGNVRELCNEVERLYAIYPGGGRIPPQTLSARLRRRERTTAAGFREMLRDFKVEVVLRALEESGGNRSHAAQRLGIQRSNLVRMLRELPLMDRVPRRSGSPRTP
ncbi:MAG TPA: sigma 54-interacting transcriptional regulator, partial [Myxococcota bacterium]|nr:sigma 54-interacting transcriptional regulator [Myxococcota bacterium]